MSIITTAEMAGAKAYDDGQSKDKDNPFDVRTPEWNKFRQGYEAAFKADEDRVTIDDVLAYHPDTDGVNTEATLEETAMEEEELDSLFDDDEEFDDDDESDDDHGIGKLT